jgi:predicted negative regulator of RcsB-dependent stress response
MAAYDLEEQEQLAELKAWWKQHGNLVLGTVAAVLLLFAAWNGWRWYQRSQALEAAALYENLQQAARMSDGKAVRDTAGGILEKYAGTAYAPLAALVSAKVNYQAGDLKTARAQLQWAVDNARQEEVRAIARLRLATVLMDDNAYDEAMKIVEAKPAEGFDALFASMRGDILSAQKKRAEARMAYKAAVEKATDAAFRETLRLKLDALGE